MDIVKEVFKYRELLFELVKRDLKIKYRRSALGIVWSILNPLIFMFATTLIFSTMFRNQIENFPLYFLSGQIIYTFFAESTSLAQTGIISNGGLIKKVYTPKYIFPISKICFSFINTSLSLIAVVIIVLFLNYRLPLTSVLFFLPFLLVFLFSIGIGLFLSTITVFYRDVLHIYSVFLSLLSFFSATFYPIEIIPESIRTYIEFNPIYIYINYFRILILDGQLPDLKLNLLAIFYSVFSLYLGYKIFKKNENKLVLFI